MWKKIALLSPKKAGLLLRNTNEMARGAKNIEPALSPEFFAK